MTRTKTAFEEYKEVSSFFEKEIADCRKCYKVSQIRSDDFQVHVRNHSPRGNKQESTNNPNEDVGDDFLKPIENVSGTRSRLSAVNMSEKRIDRSSYG